MGLLDEWDKVKRGENDRQKREKFALNNNQAPKSPVKKSNISPGIMNNTLAENSRESSPGGRVPSILPHRYGNKQQFDEANYRGPSPSSVSQASLFDELMGKITSDWSGIDKSKIDYSPLDKALAARMDALNGLRSKSQGNFDKSDANLESMHRGFQNHIQTDGASRFNKIADGQQQNLTQGNDVAQGNLAKIKADDMAKRQAMLKNLGIEEAGAQQDTSADSLNQAIGSIESREQADIHNANENRATNLAYNQGIATSVGQQGVERRGDLAQQLQQIFGRIDMASADAQAENAQQRFALEQQEGGRQYDQFRNNQGFLQETLGMVQDDAFRRDEMAAKQGQVQPQEVGGFAGIGQDLMNSGYEIPEVQNAMSVLSQITSGDYRKGIDPNAGYNDVSILNRRLQENGISPMLAIQLATNYANMGNTSKYEARPY